MTLVHGYIQVDTDSVQQEMKMLDEEKPYGVKPQFIKHLFVIK